MRAEPYALSCFISRSAPWGATEAQQGGSHGGPQAASKAIMRPRESEPEITIQEPRSLWGENKRAQLVEVLANYSFNFTAIQLSVIYCALFWEYHWCFSSEASRL
jgi:hypothetical protein